MSRVLVLPPNPSEEGTVRGPLVDIFGNAFSTEAQRIVNGYGAGWLFYSTRNPATGLDEPKMAYLKGIDWDGTPAAISAGIYRPDLPITCSPEEVNAMELASDPSADRLQNFVRCAALELEANGYFAAISLSADPRWTHKSIYVFGVDRHGKTLFSGDPSFEQWSYADSDLTSLSDRDDLSVAQAFGETFLYYKSLNPATQTKRRKVIFVKRVVSHGQPILIGAGYFADVAGQGGTATLRYWQAPSILNPYFSTGNKDAEAASLVIDRDTLVRVGYGEAGRLTCNVWIGSPAQTSTRNDECLVQNIDLANQILDDAGIVDSDGDGVRERNGVPLKILYQTSTNSVRQATQEHIKGWRAEIGVETELKDINPSVYFGDDPDDPDTLGRFYADVQMFADGAGAPDAEGYLGSWVTSQIVGASISFLSSNVPRFQSDEYDRLYAELQRTVGKDRRDELTVELNDLLVQSYSLIPLIHRGNVSAHSNAIEGVWMNAWDSELRNFETWTRRK